MVSTSTTGEELEQRVAELVRLNGCRGKAEAILEKILDNILPICVNNTDLDIIFTNESYNAVFGTPTEGMKCYESQKCDFCYTGKCPQQIILNGKSEYIFETFRKGEQGKQDRSYIVTAKPLLNHDNQPSGVIESFQDITEHKRIEENKNQLISELQGALTQVKLLSGFFPICASCKKIRDGQGSWNQIESYIRDHSEAKFSHCICPECANKLYPELVDKK